MGGGTRGCVWAGYVASPSALPREPRAFVAYTFREMDLSNVRLATPNLALRELEQDDLGAVQGWATDPEVCRFMTWGPNTDEDTRAFLAFAATERRREPRVTFELGVEHEGRLVGAGGLRIRSEANRSGDLGYVLRRDRWGLGWGTEVARALLRFGHEQLGLHRIWATCDVDNVASARVLEKIGMLREGRMKHHMRRHGVWRDSFLYAWVENG